MKATNKTQMGQRQWRKVENRIPTSPLKWTRNQKNQESPTPEIRRRNAELPMTDSCEPDSKVSAESASGGI
jgi:hypothetical protein